jgi:iron complex outermembrane receptor protein
MLQIVSQFALPKALATCFAAWSIFLAATAQSGQADQSESSAIEEVVVTAEFRPVSAAEVPGSVSVLDPDASGDLINHLDELLSRAANVNLTSGASRARFFQIRGIGERSQFVEPLNPSVGFIVDGVDLSGLGGAATLFDVQQVEVLRGPQGTLYGANAMAGLINVVTPDVTENLSGSLQVDAGNYSARGAGGVLAGPIGDDVGFRISARTYQDDGFIDNIYLNRDDTNARDERTLRGKLQGKLSKGSWQLAAGSIDVDNGYDAFSLDNNRNTRSDEPGRDAQESLYLAFNATTKLSDAVLGEVALGWVDSDMAYGYDEDWTFDGFHPFGYRSADLYLRDVETRTADVRLLSAPGQGLVDGAVDWLVGLYALDKEVDFSRDYTFAGGLFSSDYAIDRLALYGELAAKLANDMRISVGLRAEQHESSYRDSAGVQFSPDDDLVGGRLLLERSLASGNLLYMSLTRGYKAGGFNTDGSLDADLREFDPESLWNMEVGFKGSLMDERLALSAALFRMQRRDVQISTSITQLREDDTAEFIGYTGNGAKGVNQGVEVEAVLQATDRLQLTASAGLLDAEFEDYINGSGEDLDGRDQAQAPAYQYYFAVDYRFTQALRLNISLEGKDDYYFSDGHAERSPSYAVYNGSLRYSVDAWELSAWGRNLGDKDYFVRGFSFPNDPRDGYTATRWTQLGSPRQFGVSAKVSF